MSGQELNYLYIAADISFYFWDLGAVLTVTLIVNLMRSSILCYRSAKHVYGKCEFVLILPDSLIASFLCMPVFFVKRVSSDCQPLN